MRLLTSEGRARVEAAVAAAEARSSGEIVVAVVGQSASYAGRRSVAALVVAVGVALLGLHLLPRVWPDVWLLALVPLWALLYAAFARGALLRLVVPPADADVAARKRARLLFAEHGLHRTRDHTGVLVMVSEEERRVVILGDEAVDRLVGADGWAGIVADLGRAIASGKAPEGLVGAVERVGGVLAEHFPRRADDTNELPDAVLDVR
jgi:putative membrane protein